MDDLIATALLMALGSAGPTVTPLDETRFRVRIVYDDRSVAGHANAQIALIRAASKQCKGRGVAVSEGTLEANSAEPLKRGKKAIDLSEVYACKPKR